MLLPRITDVTMKHLSMLAIGECELGDSKSGLALIAVPSLLKYHSGERGIRTGTIAGIGIGVPIAGTAGRGNTEVTISSRAIKSAFSFSSLNLSNDRRADSLRG